MNVPKILLLSATPPGPQGVGGIILRELCNFYQQGEISGYFLLPSGSQVTLPDELRNMPVATGFLPMERLAAGRWKRLGKLFSLPLFWYRRRTYLAALVKAAATFGRGQQVEKVWAVLDSPTAIALAAPVAQQLGIPLITLVWDDVHHLAAYYGLDRLTVKGVVDSFANALRRSERCAVIGETMKKHYEDKYGTSCVILRHGVPDSLVHKSSSETNDASYSIGFAGTVSAQDAFKTLLSALDINNWRVGGRPVRLRLIGYRFLLSAPVPVEIEYLGWRSVTETIKLLSEMDVLYLPQPFTDAQSNLAQLSFPTKLTTYLAAGRPILLHAPAGASLADFFKKYPAGIWCDTLDTAQLFAKVEKLCTNRKQYATAIEWGQRALRKEFSEEVFKQNFAKFIGIDKGQLQPVKEAVPEKNGREKSCAV